MVAPNATPDLYAALAAFQAEMPKVAKDKVANVPTRSGGSFKYTYADLASISETVTPLLTKHGLAFIVQPYSREDGSYAVRGVLAHTSGGTITAELPLYGHDAQSNGSSLTYARRYLMGCLTGVVTDDDDDGQASMGTAPARAPRPKSAPPEETLETALAELRQTASERDAYAVYQRYEPMLDTNARAVLAEAGREHTESLAIGGKN